MRDPPGPPPHLRCRQDPLQQRRWYGATRREGGFFFCDDTTEEEVLKNRLVEGKHRHPRRVRR